MMFAGFLLIFGFALHPTGEDLTNAIHPLWVPAHAVLWAAFTVALLGWVGVYLVQASRAGRLGVAGFVVVMLGTSLASWIFSSDVTYVPVIAARSPELFPSIFSPGHVMIGAGSVLTWVLGAVLFGASVSRAKVFSRWAGVLLIVGSVIIPVAYLMGLPEKVVATGGLLVGLSQIWLGIGVLRILNTSKMSPG